MAATDQRAGTSVLTPTRVLLCCSAAVVVGWLVVFVVGWAAWDADAGTPARGQFGDSFGTIGALFSGLAFVGATTAAFLQREQLNEHRREIREMVAADEAKAVEGCFFHLLASLQAAVNETRLRTTGGGSVVGRQAVRRIADHLVHDFAGERNRRSAGRELPPEDRRADIDAWYDRFHAGEYEVGRMRAARFGDLVAHLCRLTCHILRFIDESGIGWKEKAFYARSLRAHLSSPELVLLFYNCLSRHGYPDHHRLTDRYNMFEDMNRGSLVNPYDVLLYESLARFAPPLADDHTPGHGRGRSQVQAAPGSRTAAAEGVGGRRADMSTPDAHPNGG